MMNTLILTAEEFKKISLSLSEESSLNWRCSVVDLDTYIVTLFREMNVLEKKAIAKEEFKNKSDYLGYINENKEYLSRSEDILSKSEDHLFKKDLLSEEQKNVIRANRVERGYIGEEPEPEVKEKPKEEEPKKRR